VRSRLALALLLVVAACSGGDSEATSTTESSTTTTTQPTTTTTAPTTTTTTLAPVAFEDEWKLSIFGVGPIQIGMSVAAAERAGSITLEGELVPEVSETCYHVTALGDLAGVSFMIIDDVIARIEIESPSRITTLSGARIGSSVDTLRELWPDRLQDANDLVVDGTAVAFVPQDEADQDYRVVFELDADGLVTRMRSGILPAVGFGEGCL
jgi:hypothetical protein